MRSERGRARSERKGAWSEKVSRSDKGGRGVKDEGGEG